MAPVSASEWTSQITSREVEAIQPLLDEVARLKAEGLTGGAVAINFTRRLLQPIQNRVHPAYEYWGQVDPTRILRRKVSKPEMVARVKELFRGVIRNKACPRAFSVINPLPPVSTLTSSVDLS